jgi:tetratricopeptide (TPR) repeat protein
MKKNIRNLLTFVLVVVSVSLFGQTIKVPNFAVSTHPFLVNQVTWLKDSFMIELTIENQSPKGYFCASKNIYLQNIKSKKKLRMIRSEGIPVCPNVYHFKWKGEKLTFKLFFPKPDTNIRYVDVIENCKDHCFSIFGLILNPKINEAINEGYAAFDNNDLQKAFQNFKKAIDGNPAYPYGFLYANIIKVLTEQKNYTQAKAWYQQLKQKDFLDEKAILEQISKESYFDKLK